MILDWKKHCEQIEQTEMLSRDDPSDNKAVFKQEIIYVSYLIKKGYGFIDAKNKWLKIKNGTAEKFDYDASQLTTQFIQIWNKATCNKYLQVADQELKKIQIFQEEIDKIDKMPIPKWEKEFFFALLCYYKFASQYTKTVEFSTTVINWIFRLIDFGNYSFRTYRDIRETINKTNRQSNPHLIKFHSIKKVGQYSSYTLSYLEHKGKLIIELSNLDEIKEAFYLLHENSRNCSLCGKNFIVNSKTKRTLCDSCYTLNRKRYKADKEKQYYLAKK